MNEHLFTNNDGLRLITQFEGAPRLKARRCEGGAWELSYGVTFYPDGSPVREGDTCTEEEAMAMFRHALQVFEEAVKRLVTVPLTSHQFSALVAFCYNIGESNMASSTVLKEVNAGRFDDAAAAFGMWVFATLDGYKQAFRGLLRRRYAEAACFLGYDWTEACADEAIALQRQKPATLPGRDTVIYKTPFKDVLRVAQRYPLSPATQPAPEAKPAPAAIPDSAIAIPNTPAAPPQATAKAGTQEDPTPQPRNPPASPAQNPASVPSGPTMADAGPAVQAAPAPPVSTHPGNAPVPKVTFPKEEPKVAPPPVVVAGQDGAKPKSPNTTLPADVPYKIDPNAGLKPIDESDRVKGYVIQQIGIGAIRLGSLGVFGTTIQAGAQTVQGDPVLSNIVLMGVVAGGIALTGYVVKVYGDWKRRRGEERSSQALF